MSEYQQTSPFFYDNSWDNRHPFGYNPEENANYNAFTAEIDGVYYFCMDKTGRQLGFDGEYFNVGLNCNTARYDAESKTWIPDSTLGYTILSHVPISAIKSQTLDSSVAHYQTKEQFFDGSVFAPTGTVFDAIYFDSPLDEILPLLSIVFPVLIAAIAIRKGIAFVRERIKGA